MTRSVSEWFGKTDDTPVPTRVKLRILRRQNDTCAGDGCAVVFSARNSAGFDHRPALCNGGENRESKIFVLCVPCHDKLFPGDMAEKSKVNDTKAKHLGLIAKRPWPKRLDPWGREFRKKAAAKFYAPLELSKRWIKDY